MITKGDDYPIHQLPIPVAEVGTERNFYDRYFFNGYNKEGRPLQAPGRALAVCNMVLYTIQGTCIIDIVMIYNSLS